MPILQLKAIIPRMCIASVTCLTIMVLSGCGNVPSTGGTPNTGYDGKPNVIVLRDWPDRLITGGDAEVANLHHLSIDKKVVDVWSTWGRGSGISPVKIVIGLRDHAWDDLKNWKVRITSPTIWGSGFTTATVKMADGRLAQHPDFKNGVVVFREGRQFKNDTEPGGFIALNVGAHTVTVEMLDEQDRVKAVAVLPMTVYKPGPGPQPTPLN